MQNADPLSSSEDDLDYSSSESLDIEANNKIEPEIGMTFASDEAAKNWYNQYAKQKGFGTKIKSSYSDRKTKEKKFVWFSCCKEGFKAENPNVVHKRPIVRVGCNAHMKINLTDCKNWSVTAVNLHHNHACSPSKAHRYRSHKYLGAGAKKKLELHCDAGIRLNKSYHSVVLDAGGFQKITFGKKQARNHVDKYKRLKLKEGDAEAMHKYFTRMQQKNQNFFHLVDLDEEGRVRNVFWADARSRSAYEYFGDVVTFDTTYRTNRYDLKFAPFVGVNHHGQSVLFGAGLLADETTESFVWLFRAWLSAMSGRPPKAIITDQCKAMENAIKQVFPDARHRLCLWHIMKKLSDKLGSLTEYKEIKKTMKNAVYNSLRISEFEEAWTKMIETYKLKDNPWLTKLYTLREMWVPVYLKDVFFAGMSTTQRSESMNSYFDGFVQPRTALREFIVQFGLALDDNYEKENQADFDSYDSNPILKTSCVFEGQIAKVYTAGMFSKFQEEIYGMASCSKSEVRVDGQITTYDVKERILSKKGKLYPPRVYEVTYNSSEVDIFCICRLFQHKGILCRHALCVLNDFVDEIPSRYIIPRWRKDFKRLYVENNITANVEATNPVQRYDVLFPYVLQVAEEGMLSETNFRAVLEGIQEVKKKVSNENKDLFQCDSQTHPDDLPEASQVDSVKYLNPSQAKSVGRPANAKRLKSASEKNVEAKAKKQKQNENTTKKAPRAPRKRSNKNKQTADTTPEVEVNLTSNPTELQDNFSKDGAFIGSTYDFFAGQSLGTQVTSAGNNPGCYTDDWFSSEIPTTQSSYMDPAIGCRTGYFTDLMLELNHDAMLENSVHSTHFT